MFSLLQSLWLLALRLPDIKCFSGLHLYIPVISLLLSLLHYCERNVLLCFDMLRCMLLFTGTVYSCLMLNKARKLAFIYVIIVKD